jgi:hypothetical protein
MQFIFRKVFTRCPVFSKLKTLLLNEWCITNNLGALICFLQHSPVLEKLIIHFDSPEVHEFSAIIICLSRVNMYDGLTWHTYSDRCMRD